MGELIELIGRNFREGEGCDFGVSYYTAAPTWALVRVLDFLISFTSIKLDPPAVKQCGKRSARSFWVITLTSNPAQYQSMAARCGIEVEIVTRSYLLYSP